MYLKFLLSVDLRLYRDDKNPPPPQKKSTFPDNMHSMPRCFLIQKNLLYNASKRMSKCADCTLRTVMLSYLKQRRITQTRLGKT